MDLHLAAKPVPVEEGVSYLCFSWSALSHFPAERSLPWEDYIDVGPGGEIESLTQELADSWQDPGFTDFDGISLGKTFRLMFWIEGLMHTYKFAEALRAAAAAHSAKRLICQTAVPERYRRLAEHLAPQLGLELKWLDNGEEGGASHRWRLPQTPWPASKLAVGAALNAMGLLGPRGRPLLVHYYASMATLLKSLPPDIPLYLTDFTKSSASEMLKRKARVAMLPRLPRGLGAADAEAVERGRRAWSTLRTDATYRKRFEWRGLSLFEPVEGFIDAWMKTDFPQMAYAYRALQRCWSTRNPRAVVIYSDGDPFQHLVADVARLNGTPSVIMQHGLAFYYTLRFEDRNSTHFFVWGPGQERYYRLREPRPERSYVHVGNPGLDGLAGITPESGEAPVRKALVLSYPSIRVAACASNLDTDRYAVGVTRAMLDAGMAEVTLKLHPSETPEHYRVVLGELAERVRIERDAPIRDCLRACDVVVGSFSSVMIEAMAMGKPVICFKMSQTPVSPPFDGSRGMPVHRSVEELAHRVKQAIEQPGRFRAETSAPYAAILDEFAGPRDGRSASRVYEALSRL